MIVSTSWSKLSNIIEQIQPHEKVEFRSHDQLFDSLKSLILISWNLTSWSFPTLPMSQSNHRTWPILYYVCLILDVSGQKIHVDVKQFNAPVTHIHHHGNFLKTFHQKQSPSFGQTHFWVSASNLPLLIKSWILTSTFIWPQMRQWQMVIADCLHLVKYNLNIS
jgi:hypothetical protein